MQLLYENDSLSSKGNPRKSDSGGVVLQMLLHSSSNARATRISTSLLGEGSAITASATEGQSQAAIYCLHNLVQVVIHQVVH